MMNLLAISAAVVLAASPVPESFGVQQLFREGEVPLALARANACADDSPKCRYLSELIRTYERQRGRVNDLSVDELLSLVALDREIAGGHASATAESFMPRVVAASYAEARTCHSASDWECAVHYALQVLKLDPFHPGASRIISDAKAERESEAMFRTERIGPIILIADGDLADAAPATRKIDPKSSELYVKTFKEGMASAFAHNHVVQASKFSGTLTWDPVHLDRCKLHVTVSVNDLVVDDPSARKRVGGDWGSEVSDGDRKSVRQNMLADIQLDAAKYPEITLDADNFKCRGSGQCELDGKLTLHGVTKPIHFTAKLKAGDAPSGEGSLKFNTSDYGIKPYSAGLGTIKNKDEVELVFKLTASP